MKHSHRCPAAIFSFACLLAVTAAAAGDGGMRITSRKGDCQLTVPSGWKADAMIKSSVSAPGDVASAVISSSGAFGSLAEIKPIIQSSLVPVKTYEDSPQRLWYQYQGNGRGVGWYVGVPGKGVICGAQIGFKTAAQEDMARKIALTVGPAR